LVDAAMRIGALWIAFTLIQVCVSQAVTLRITGISASSTSVGIVVLVKSNETLPSYQRAEVLGSTIVLRIPNVVLDPDAVDTSCTNNGLLVKSELIRTMLVIRCTLASAPDSAVLKRNGTGRLALTIYNSKLQPVQITADPKWLLDVIVLDAGHGGIDAGAIGVNDVSEKTVTLAIAKKVEELIAIHLPKTRVVMTRESDVFVELFKRTQIANDAKGKLFVSIHCNSMPTKPHPAHGCETYILRPGRNADAARVAARENSSIQYERSTKRYAGMDEEQLIVATMAQRSFVRFSEELARSMQKEVHIGTGLTDRGVSQAGFYVLVGASMPNILFETAFLSNTKDAAYISSATGQQETADAIVKAIVAYAELYQRSASH